MTCRDRPEDLGFPPVEPDIKPKSGAAVKPKQDIWTSLMNNVIKNPFIWGMALTYFFIYVVRQGVTSWFVFYLIKAKGVPDAAQVCAFFFGGGGGQGRRMEAAAMPCPEKQPRRSCAANRTNQLGLLWAVSH